MEVRNKGNTDTQTTEMPCSSLSASEDLVTPSFVCSDQLKQKVFVFECLKL